ncbi:MAG: hypothetical protein RIQ56_616 [Candidatus Parcubacteria bacterium]
MKSHDDLKEAIQKYAFVTSKSGVTIIGNEFTGARDEWLFDFRALLLQPHWLNRYAEIFWEMYSHKLPFQVGGMETAGIPLVAAIVMKSVERGTPVNGFYIRKSRKRQGLMKWIEGTLTDDPIVCVDDLINSGSSFRKQIDILSDAGKKVSDVFALLRFRDQSSYSSFQENGVSLRSLFSLEDFGMQLLASAKPIPDNIYEEVWKYEAPQPSFHLVVHKSAPTVDESNVYFGCDDGTFRAIDKTNGRLRWEFVTGKHPVGKGILSSPQLHKGLVYFGAYDGNVYALDAKTGNKRWTFDDADWVGSSPDIAPSLGVLYIGLEYGLWKRRGGIVALKLDTGEMMWRAYHGALTHGSPLYIEQEGLVVIGSNDHVLYAYDAKTGTLRWKYITEGEIKMRPAYDAQHRSIIVASMDGRIYAVSATNGAPVQVFETKFGIYGTPIVNNGIIYTASLDKCVYAIDASSWKTKWIFETSGRIFASPTLIGSSLYIGSNDGRLYELDAETGKMRSSFQAIERIVSKITSDDDHLYVPTVANEIYCLKKMSK